MAVKSVLFSKVPRTIVQRGEKILGENGLEIFAPAKAVKYDILTGIGKKGHYQQYVFKGENGKAVQVYTRYNNNGVIKDVTTDYSWDGALDIRRKTQTKGDTKTEYSSIIAHPLPTGEFAFSKSFMTSTKEGDRGGIELLRRNKKPVGVSYPYNWDGTPAKIEYKNTLGHKLDITDTESRYLPLIPRRYIIIEQNGQPMLGSVDFTTDGVQKKIGLAQIIQEKLHDIEGILPRAKAVEVKDLHLLKTSGMLPEQYLAEKGCIPQGEHLGNGQINIATDIGNNADGVQILDFMAHEMQHASDTIKAYRGGKAASDEALQRVGLSINQYNELHEAEFKDLNAKEYIEKVIRIKGLAQKGTPEYEEAVNLYEMNFRTPQAKDLTSQVQHDELPFEKRAIERERQQIEFYNMVCQKVTNFLSSFLG